MAEPTDWERAITPPDGEATLAEVQQMYKELKEGSVIQIQGHYDPPDLVFNSLEELEEYVGGEFTEDDRKAIEKQGFPISIYLSDFRPAGMTPGDVPETFAVSTLEGFPANEVNWEI